ncbi:MAG: prepilin-type N-terminal cleavage/methylation domain-containing protein [Usitatibacter sp.]
MTLTPALSQGRGRKSRGRPSRSAGFTWIELMFVVAVIAIPALCRLPGMK